MHIFHKQEENRQQNNVLQIIANKYFKFDIFLFQCNNKIVKANVTQHFLNKIYLHKENIYISI